MKKIIVLMMSVIALVSCGNSVESKSDNFKEDFIDAWRTSGEMLLSYSEQVSEDDMYKDFVKEGVDSIIREAFSPFIEKYGEERVLDFINSKTGENDEKVTSIEFFFYGIRSNNILFIFDEAVKGNRTKAKDYITKCVNHMENTF